MYVPAGLRLRPEKRFVSTRKVKCVGVCDSTGLCIPVRGLRAELLPSSSCPARHSSASTPLPTHPTVPRGMDLPGRCSEKLNELYPAQPAGCKDWKGLSSKAWAAEPRLTGAFLLWDNTEWVLWR